MKIKEIIREILKQESIDHIFLIPGGLIDPFLTVFDPLTGVRPIVAAQEGGAAYMADGYARASRKFGVCLCIGGPGATNTATALLAAKSDLSPLLLLTGEVSTAMEGLGMFQDASLISLDDFDLLKPATKFSAIIENPLLFHHHFQKALRTMLTPPKSPVHICLPQDIQETDLAEISLSPLDKAYYESTALDANSADLCIEDFRETQLVILAGDGINTPQGAQALLHLSQTLDIPVATTLRTKGVFPEDHPLSLGVFGYAGTAHATQALLHEHLDVLIVLGSSLNQRDSMDWTRKLSPSKRFIQVDIDLDACNPSHPRTHLVQGDCATFINYIATKKIQPNPARRAWLQQIKQKPRFYDALNQTSNKAPIHPARVVHDLRKIAPRDTVLVVDSGAHRAFCGHYWAAYHPGEYLSATNLGPMGWAIAAGIGAKLAQPTKPCCVVTGDGCMLMQGMEIQTAAKYKIPIVYVVINNQALGNVYLRAKKESIAAMQLTEIPNHDWAALARALGAQGERVKDPSMLGEAFTRAFASNTTYLVDVQCGKDFSTPIEPFSDAQKTGNYHD
ncbi:MAG: thiamine pyrophosphate-binding protein [Chlamydiia bacterium]|nr:thiamine pyrophosphate-binding protein [Chlamydiia bacterium]